jgi:histidinol phosphatase-like PHP family hydrolase
MIQDLHSHTYYSFCGKDSPETIINAAINGGIELFGICDHNHGVGFGSYDAFTAPIEAVPHKYGKFAYQKYFEHLTLLKEKYADKITLLRGIEITAHLDIPKIAPPDDADFSIFDYCMVENPNLENSVIKRDLFTYAEGLGCKNVGVAHTDMFGFIEEGFNNFLKTNINVPKCEYYLPTVVSNLIDNGQKKVEVLVAEDRWYGITYKEDKDDVVNAIGSMIDAGLYENI